MKRSISKKQIDPDVWTILSLLVATVSMFAQLYQIKADGHKKPSKRTANPAYEHLRQSIETTILNVERLIRILGRAETTSHEAVLSGRFEFGATRALMTLNDLDTYGQLVQQIGLNAGQISSWTLNLIRNDPLFAEELGDRIATHVGDVHQRINNLYIQEHSNEQVIDECMMLLRSFDRLLAELEDPRN